MNWDLDIVWDMNWDLNIGWNVVLNLNIVWHEDLDLDKGLKETWCCAENGVVGSSVDINVV